jgi:hypothetical protein
MRITNVLVVLGLSLSTLAGCAAPPEAPEEQGSTESHEEAFDDGAGGGGGGGVDTQEFSWNYVADASESEAKGRAACRHYKLPCANSRWREKRGSWEENVTNVWTAIANGGPANETNPAGTETFVHSYRFMWPDDATGYCAGLFPANYKAPMECFPYGHVALPK